LGWDRQQNGVVETVHQAARYLTAVWHPKSNRATLKLTPPHCLLRRLLSGYDHIEAEEHHPGQELLAHQLQAQLLLNLYEGSSLYPVVKDLALDWPLQTLTKVLAHESAEKQKEKREKLKGGGIAKL
jgi:hypothetical protein